MRPEPLDREENDGPGSDIDPREWNQKDQTRQPSALAAPVIIQSAAVLEAVKARPGSGGVCLYAGTTAGLDSLCARRRPKSTVGAEESLRRGRTKEMTQEGRRRLRSWRRLENERMVARQSNEITPARYVTSDGTSGSSPNLRNPLRTSKRQEKLVPKSSSVLRRENSPVL